MNSWNCSTSYAHCVKIWNLELPKELEDKFWQLQDVEYNDFYMYDIPDMISDFRHKYGYDVGFNGKSGGYLVMYEMEFTGNGRYSVYPGKSIDMYEDFNNKDEWSMHRLKERVELVQAFDKLCDDIRDELIWYLKTHDFVDEEYVVKKTKKVAKEKELCE
jgi:hypothetical protein